MVGQSSLKILLFQLIRRNFKKIEGLMELMFSLQDIIHWIDGIGFYNQQLQLLVFRNPALRPYIRLPLIWKSLILII